MAENSDPNEDVSIEDCFLLYPIKALLRKTKTPVHDRLVTLSPAWSELM